MLGGPSVSLATAGERGNGGAARMKITSARILAAGNIYGRSAVVRLLVSDQGMRGGRSVGEIGRSLDRSGIRPRAPCWVISCRLCRVCVGCAA